MGKILYGSVVYTLLSLGRQIGQIGRIRQLSYKFGFGRQFNTEVAKALAAACCS